MKKQNPIEYLTGFLIGSFFGFFSECLFLLFFRLVCIWLGWVQLEIPWWMLIPVPLLIGLSMGKAIAHLHLEDY
jgi:hypothetical protein